MNAERMKERYWKRRNARQCVSCEAGLQETDSIYCVECYELHADSKAKYDETHREQISERQSKRMREKYAKDPAGHAKKKRDERNARKLKGECYECPAKALDDSGFCQKHLDKNRDASRERGRRRTGYYDRHPEERFCDAAACEAASGEPACQACGVEWKRHRMTCAGSLIPSGQADRDTPSALSAPAPRPVESAHASGS